MTADSLDRALAAYEFEREEHLWTRWPAGRRIEAIWATGPHDASPAHNGLNSTMGGDYDARCASCWLGHGHTASLHAQRITERERRDAAI